MLVSTVPTGILADRWGQKRVILLGMLLDMLPIIALAVFRSPTALLAFFAVRGVAIGARDGADEALLYDSYVEENGTSKGYNRAFGKMLSNDTLGFVIATAVAGFGVQFFGASSYIPLILVTALATFVSMLLGFTLRVCKHHTEHPSKAKFLDQIKSGMKVVKTNHTIKALTIFGLLTLSGEYFLRQTYQPQFEQAAVPAIFLGLALSAGNLLNFITMRNVHRLEKYFTVDKLLLLITLALGVAYVLLGFSRSAWAVVVVFMLIQGLLNTQQPIISDYVNQQIESGRRSTTLSAISFVQNMGQVIARVLLGISIGAIGLGHTYIAQGIYLILGGIIGVWYIRSCGCIYKIKHKENTSPAVTAQLAN